MSYKLVWLGTLSVLGVVLLLAVGSGWTQEASVGPVDEPAVAPPPPPSVGPVESVASQPDVIAETVAAEEVLPKEPKRTSSVATETMGDPLTIPPPIGPPRATAGVGIDPVLLYDSGSDGSSDPPYVPHADIARPTLVAAWGPEMQKLIVADQQAEQAVKDLAEQLRREKDAEKRAELRKGLEELTGKHFDIRQQQRQLQIAQMEAELDKIRQKVQKRTEAKKLIVGRRVSQLLGEEDELDFPSSPVIQSSQRFPGAAIYDPWGQPRSYRGRNLRGLPEVPPAPHLGDLFSSPALDDVLQSP